MTVKLIEITKYSKESQDMKPIPEQVNYKNNNNNRITANGLKTAGSANGFWSNPDMFGSLHLSSLDSHSRI